MKRALITGVAGFIGSSLAETLVAQGWQVVGVDNFDPYYSTDRKRRNLCSLGRSPFFRLVEADVRDFAGLCAGVSGEFDAVVHLAAKAGVRPSLVDPLACQQTNVCGTQNMLEMAKRLRVGQFVFASSSSVYGENPNVPWREDDLGLKPISPYASSKVSGELLGQVYSRLYGIRFIALRFFTVYGPRQRPDLAVHKFSRLMLGGKPLPLYGDGTTQRDYTYIDDIVEGIRAAMAYDRSMYEVINLGNNHTVSLAELILHLEELLGVKAEIRRYPEQAGDVPRTWANISKAKALLGYQPRTEFREGLRRFAEALRDEAPIADGRHRVGGAEHSPTRTANGRAESGAVRPPERGPNSFRFPGRSQTPPAWSGCCGAWPSSGAPGNENLSLTPGSSRSLPCTSLD
jgi:UDP-glucuronate 4-epimerase